MLKPPATISRNSQPRRRTFRLASVDHPSQRTCLYRVCYATISAMTGGPKAGYVQLYVARMTQVTCRTGPRKTAQFSAIFPRKVDRFIVGIE